MPAAVTHHGEIMRQQVKAQVTISTHAQNTLLEDIYQRRRIEACGLLTGSIDECGSWHIEQVHPLRNIFDSPVYFEFAPEDILSVELNHPEQVIGAYHSHPTGLAVASSTDRRNMKRVNVAQQIPWVWLIVSGPFDKALTSLQQVQRRSRRLTGPSIIAYHHYQQQGLQQLRIQLETATEAISSAVQEQGYETIGHESSQNSPDAL